MTASSRDSGAAAPHVAVTAVPSRVLRMLAEPRMWLVVLVCGYVALLGPLIAPGTADFGLVGVFSTDEALAGRLVQRMLTERTPDPAGFFAYGALYHEVAALLLVPSPDVGERGIILTLRGVSLAATVVTLLLTYALGARQCGRWGGLAAAMIVAASPEVARWSVTAHPDTLQLALVTGTLLVACRLRDAPSARLLVLGGALAGLAFGTKYAGGLTLPLLAVATLAGRVARGDRGLTLVRVFLLDLVELCTAFMAAYLASNPYAVAGWRGVLTQVQAEMGRTREGHVVRVAWEPWRWIGRLTRPTFAAVWLMPVALAGWIIALRSVPNRTDVAAAERGDLTTRAAARMTAHVLVGGWTLGYLAFLLISVRYLELRHALLLLPGFAVMAVVFGMRAGRKQQRPALAVALVALALLPALPPFIEFSGTRRAQAANPDANAQVAAGVWLRENAARDAAMILDAYVYRPSSLTGASETFGLTAVEVERTQPVLIVVNEQIRGRYRDAEGGTRYVDGAAAYTARRDAYARLEAGVLGCYRLVWQRADVAIYADEAALRRSDSRGCGLSIAPP